MNTSPLRIVFAGTPDFAARHLQALLQPALQNRFSVVGVFTRPDRPSGRGKVLTASPVKSLALAHDVPVFQPQNLRSTEALDELRALKPDVLVVVAYGLMLPQEVLDLPRFGCLNVHASLLPRWRGAAPIERAILEGDAETGVAIMQMDAGLDTGAVHKIRRTAITVDDNSKTVTERLVTLGCDALIDTLQKLGGSAPTTTAQSNELATYAAKLTKSEAAVDWNKTAARVTRQIQAFYPRSPAYTFMGKDRVMLLEARPGTTSSALPPGTIISANDSGLCVACAEGAINLARVQLSGKKPVTVKDLLNGKRESFLPGARFSSEPVL